MRASRVVWTEKSPTESIVLHPVAFTINVPLQKKGSWISKTQKPKSRLQPRKQRQWHKQDDRRSKQPQFRASRTISAGSRRGFGNGSLQLAARLAMSFRCSQRSCVPRPAASGLPKPFVIDYRPGPFEPRAWNEVRFANSNSSQTPAPSKLPNRDWRRHGHSHGSTLTSEFTLQTADPHSATTH